MKRNKRFFIFSTFAAFLLIITAGCNSGYRYTEEGLDTVIKQYRDTPDYTIILYDQNYENGKYLHQYQVLIPKTDSTFDTQVTEFLPVSDRFFNANIDHLGMEMAHKKDGIVSKNVAPAGYSQYVGNPHYGHWVQRDGNSFWAFYGKYAFMSSMFHMMATPARYGYWNDYNRNYAPYGKSYTGPNHYYGTKSYMNSRNGKNTSWSRQSSSFRNDVRSRVQRSASTSKSRVSRSGSRYSSRSGSRSRGGGFGK